MSPKFKSPLRFARLLHAHRRLWISVAVGIAVFAMLSFAVNWAAVTRLLAAWDIAVLLYLAGAAWMMARSPVSDIRRHSAAQDEGAFALLILTVAAAMASLGAIFVHLAAVDPNTPGYGIYATHAVVTVLLSWAFIHTIFALHYAYEFYGEGKRANGLNFPGVTRPDYWDFVYFAFVIGMTFQVSDVAITNKWIRRTVICHGILAFFYTTSIIALTVNIAGAAFSR